MGFYLVLVFFFEKLAVVCGFWFCPSLQMYSTQFDCCSGCNSCVTFL